MTPSETEEKRIGKIKNVRIGIGGYQDAMLGLHVELGGDDWGVNHSDCTWDAELVQSSMYSKWNESDRDKMYAEIMRRISRLLKDAKVTSVDRLKGIPIEVTFENRTLKEWRILTEVL